MITCKYVIYPHFTCCMHVPDSQHVDTLLIQRIHIHRQLFSWFSVFPSLYKRYCSLVDFSTRNDIKTNSLGDGMARYQEPPIKINRVLRHYANLPFSPSLAQYEVPNHVPRQERENVSTSYCMRYNLFISYAHISLSRTN